MPRFSETSLFLMSLAAALAAYTTAHADQAASEPVDHTIVVGIGGALEFEIADRSLHPGANLMVEWEAVENWLELEIEASLLSVEGGLEIPVSLLVKKPFRVTSWFELMLGLGPEVVHVSQKSANVTHFGGQVAVDFMFWPTKRVGLWIEPSYDFIFRKGVSHGIGGTGGLLLGW